MDYIHIGTAGGDDIFVEPQSVQQVKCFGNNISVLFKDGSPDCVRYGDELYMDRQTKDDTTELVDAQEHTRDLRHHIAKAAEKFYKNNNTPPQLTTGQCVNMIAGNAKRAITSFLGLKKTP